MSTTTGIPQTAPSNRTGWVSLLAASAFLPFANGKNTISIAAWISAVLIVRAIRALPVRFGLSAGYAVFLVTWLFQFRGMVPAPIALRYCISAVFAFVAFLPFVVDRMLAPQLRGIAATLVLPLAWTSIEYLFSFHPYGSWGSIAYSQYGNLPLMQVVSVTGLWGITFLIGWFASALNDAWEHDFRLRECIPAWGFVAVFAIVIIGGGFRLTLFAPSAKNVRVASLSRGGYASFPNAVIAGKFATNEPLSEDELSLMRKHSAAANRDLLMRSETEAKAGAKIVFWGEANGSVFKEDEPAFLAEAATVAKRNQIYLGPGYVAWIRNSPKPMENKIVLIQPDGAIAYEFWKARPVPGGEAALSRLQDGHLRYAVTPYGRISSAICFDMDHPGLLHQAGQIGADTLLVPSNDWRAIDPWHTQMAVFRAIEQGFNLVRHTSYGLSLAVDSQGRTLAQMDHYTTLNRSLISYVPDRGSRTIYSGVTDVFSWSCLTGLLALVLLALHTKSPQSEKKALLD